MIILFLKSLPTLQISFSFALKLEVGTAPYSYDVVLTSSGSTALLGSVHPEPYSECLSSFEL